MRPRWPVGALVLLCAAVFLSVTTEMLPTGLLPAMSRDLRVTAARLGLLVTGYAFMVALFAAPLGTATMRVRRRVLLTAALGGYALSNVLLAVSTVYPVAVVARLVGGLTHGVFWAMLAGYTARLVTPDRVGRAVTLVSAGGTLAMLVGVPAGTALGVAIGWRPAFAVLAGIAAVLLLLGWRLLPDLSGDTAAVRTPLNRVARLPGFAAVIATTAITMLGHFCFITYVAPFLQHAGLTEAGIGPALLTYGLAGAGGLITTGLLVDRRPREASVGASVVLTVALILLAAGGGSPVLAVTGVAMTGFALGMLPVFLQAATLRVAPGLEDQASAINAAAFNVGIGGGALLGGLVLDGWGAAALPVVGGLLALAGLVVQIGGMGDRSRATMEA